MEFETRYLWFKNICVYYNSTTICLQINLGYVNNLVFSNEILFLVYIYFFFNSTHLAEMDVCVKDMRTRKMTSVLGIDFFGETSA